MAGCLSRRHTLELFRPSGSPIPVFLTLRRYPIPRGTRQQEPKMHGDGKICNFRLKSPSISRKRCEIRPLLLWNVNRKS